MELQAQEKREEVNNHIVALYMHVYYVYVSLAQSYRPYYRGSPQP